MNFLETENEVKTWFKHQNLIIPVLSDHKKHWSQNRISFVYCYDLTSFQEAIISFNHCDSINLQIYVLTDFLGKNNYIYQKKYLCDYTLNYDAQIKFWLETNQPLKVDFGNSIRSYYNSVLGVENLNDSIPIMKWLEWCRDLKDEFVSKVRNYEITETLQEYDKLLFNLAIIESNGLFTN